MFFSKIVGARGVIATCFVVGIIASLTRLPQTVVRADEPDHAKKSVQITKSGAGEFVSYKDGTLTLQGRGGLLVWKNVSENFKAFHRGEDGSIDTQLETVEALSMISTGMAVRVNGEKNEIYYGVDEQTHGTFVSYQDGRLTLIGRAEELGPSFTKKYGTSLTPQIDPKTPVFESIDGSEFKQIGTAEALKSVKEGTVVTLRGKNDRVNLVQIGVPKKGVSKKQTIDQADNQGFGRFVSFKDGTLTLESNSGHFIVWKHVAENIKTFVFNPELGDYKLVDDGKNALNQVKAERYVMVGQGRAFIRIGARVEQVRGSFLSFKNERLLMMGKELPSTFTKKYGNNLHYNMFRDDVPVYQSVDGGQYTLLGTANKVLGEVKEGTLVIVHGEGDDNITLIQLGMPSEK